jgi:hypothetical protein
VGITPEHERHAKRFFGFYVVTAITTGAAIIYVAFNYPQVRAAYEEVPVVARYTYLGAWLALTMFRLWQRRDIDDTYRERLRTDYEFLRRHNRRELIPTLLGQGLLAVGCLYLAGWLLPVASFLASTFTFLGVQAWNLITSIVSWVASGVVGNFVYDLLKRGFSKPEGKATAEPSAAPDRPGE